MIFVSDPFITLDYYQGRDTNYYYGHRNDETS